MKARRDAEKFDNLKEKKNSVKFNVLTKII